MSGDFVVDITSFAKNANRALEDTAQAVVLNLFKGVIEATPVGSPSIWKDQEAAARAVANGYTGGRARGNWQLTDESEATGVLDFSDGTQGLRAADNTISELGNIKVGTRHFLTNNLPYINRLEYEGHSGQAPDGMVRKNMLRIMFTLREITRENAL